MRYDDPEWPSRPPRPPSPRTLASRMLFGCAGPGESGKSTLFKQMKLIYGVGFTPEEVDNFTLVVFHNILTAMRALVQACDDFGYEITSDVSAGSAGGGRGGRITPSLTFPAVAHSHLLAPLRPPPCGPLPLRLTRTHPVSPSCRRRWTSSGTSQTRR